MWRMIMNPEPAIRIMIRAVATAIVVHASKTWFCLDRSDTHTGLHAPQTGLGPTQSS